jgi:MFS family permease
VIGASLLGGTILQRAISPVRRSEVGGIGTESASAGRPSSALRAVLAPLALAQFICSFAGSNMNVMITDMSEDLNTSVQGIQVAITIFLLVMAALMIPGGKLTDKYGRKRLFMLGLIVYASGAVLSAVSPGLGLLILGNSILEGIGTAMLIPPVYILTRLLFTEFTSRARAFGVISALGGIGAAAGPLIGGLITSAISWRAAFIFQALIIAVIVFLSRKITDLLPPDPTRSFDTGGAVLSSVGLVLVVMGILAADNNLWLMIILIVVGALVLTLFFRSIRAKEKAGKEPLLSTSLFHNRTSNLALVTQNTQWVMLLGTSFVVSAFLQVVRGYNAIQTGIIFTAATLGLLVSSLAAERLAKRRSQRTLILAGFILTIAGIAVLLLIVSGSPTAWHSRQGCCSSV